MDEAAPICPLCVWFLLAFVVVVFAAVLWRNHRARITRMDLRSEDQIDDAIDRARRSGL